jgi:transposase-like protein
MDLLRPKSATALQESALLQAAHGLIASANHRGDFFDGVDSLSRVLREAYWQRWYVHFLRNALDFLPRKGGDDCLTELPRLYGRRNAGEARRNPRGLVAALAAKARVCGQEKYPKLCAWVKKTSKKPDLLSAPASITNIFKTLTCSSRLIRSSSAAPM